MHRDGPALGRILAAFLASKACYSGFAYAGDAGALVWSDTIGSPHPAPVAARTGVDRSDKREGELDTLCPDGDVALRKVAGQIASHTVAADDVEAINAALRAAGDPHVWPRAFLLEGKSVDLGEAKTRLKTWLAEFRRPLHLRCGVATLRSPEKEVVAAVAFDAQADLAPIVVRARPSSWVDIDAKVLAPATGAKVVVLGPTGTTRPLLTSFSGGRVKARANVDREGTWLFQVVVDGASGPRPVLEAYVFAGVEPSVVPAGQGAPGEEAGSEGDGAMALARMTMLARRSEGLPGLVRDPALDRLARTHADRMMRAKKLGHDVGDGDPKERVERAGMSFAEVGENVAHAAKVTLAHRVLWSSPSHRDNLLQARFDRIGVGVSTDADGSVWVTELFATSSADTPSPPRPR